MGKSAEHSLAKMLLARALSQLRDDNPLRTHRRALHRRLADPLKERDEHRLMRVAPPIVTEANLIEVHLEIFCADGVM